MYLFPTDGSEQSRHAEDTLSDLADPDRTRILVLTVIDQEPNPFANPDKKADYETALIEKAEERVEAASNRLEDRGFQVETEIEHGDPGQVICRMVDDRNIERIVMARRGLGTAGELLLGSVSHYVVHHASCPVTVVPNTPDSA
jgi:nucleotide-binding universal stress UspA family protein